MDSTNFDQQAQHQQHLQEAHFVGCSHINTDDDSSVGYGVSTTTLDWNPLGILSTSRTSNNTFSNKLYDGEFHTVGDSRPESSLSSSCTTAIPSITNDNDARNLTYHQASSNLPKIEEDMLGSFSSFSSLLGNPSTTSMDNLVSWFNGFPTSAAQYYKDHQNLSHNNMNNWSVQGFPSSNLLNQLGLASSPSSTTSVSSSSPRLGLNLQAMDFLGNNSASFGAPSRRPYDNVAGEEVMSPSGNKFNVKASTVLNGVTGTKRPATPSYNSDQQQKASASNSTSSKKTPLKVRKEKLGDRIAALHQIVSPFGKTDTASVLTEVIGYIQFLQDQIHTLCMPPAKHSRNKAARPFQMEQETEDEGKEESRLDLRRRGLCLVPVSWTSYITPSQMDASNPSYY